MRKILSILLLIMLAISAQAGVTNLNIDKDTTVIDRYDDGVGQFYFTYVPSDTATGCNMKVSVEDAFTGKPIQEDITAIGSDTVSQPHGWAIVRNWDWTSNTKKMVEVGADGSYTFENLEATHRYSLAAASSTYGFISVAYFTFPTGFKGTLYVRARDKKSHVTDIDGDGKTNVTDATKLNQMLLNAAITGEVDILIADYNGDGTVDVSDLTAVLTKILENE